MTKSINYLNSQLKESKINNKKLQALKEQIHKHHTFRKWNQRIIQTIIILFN